MLVPLVIWKTYKQEKYNVAILTRHVIFIIDNKGEEWVNFWISNLKITCLLWAYTK